MLGRQTFFGGGMEREWATFLRAASSGIRGGVGTQSGRDEAEGRFWGQGRYCGLLKGAFVI